MITNSISNHEEDPHKAVCGGILIDTSQYPSAIFNGEKVYFCTVACLNEFVENPEAFMAGEIEHPL
jgi:YHS domain-containing protein